MVATVLGQEPAQLHHEVELNRRLQFAQRWVQCVGERQTVRPVPRFGHRRQRTQEVVASVRRVDSIGYGCWTFGVVNLTAFNYI